MGIRTILILLALWGVYWIIRNLLNKKRIDHNERIAEDMIECHFCGTHLPLSEALEQAGEYYCCQQHLEKNDQKDKNN